MKFTEITCQYPGCFETRVVPVRCAANVKWCTDHARKVANQQQMRSRKESKAAQRETYRRTLPAKPPFILTDEIRQTWFQDLNKTWDRGKDWPYPADLLNLEYKEIKVNQYAIILAVHLDALIYSILRLGLQEGIEYQRSLGNEDE